MGYKGENFRDLLALARLLRRFAQENSYDGQHEMMLDTAAALEARAFSLSDSEAAMEQNAEPAERHAPVNLVV